MVLGGCSDADAFASALTDVPATPRPDATTVDLVDVPSGVVPGGGRLTPPLPGGTPTAGVAPLVGSADVGPLTSEALGTVVSVDRRNSSGAIGRHAGLLGLAGCLMLGGCAAGDAPPDSTQDDGRAVPPPPSTGPAPSPSAEPLPATESTTPANPDLAVDPASVDPVAAVTELVFQYANQARLDAGVPLLQRSAEMDAVARAWSERLAGNGLDLAHNPDYARLIPQGWSGAAENVAWILENGTMTPEQIATSIHEGWMNSPGHRANLLNPDYTHLGVGVAYSAQNGYYLTQNFARY